MDKIQTGIRFQEETLRKIARIAQSEHRSLNAQLEYLAEKCIAQYEKEQGEIVWGNDA